MTLISNAEDSNYMGRPAIIIGTKGKSATKCLQVLHCAVRSNKERVVCSLDYHKGIISFECCNNSVVIQLENERQKTIAQRIQHGGFKVELSKRKKTCRLVLIP